MRQEASQIGLKDVAGAVERLLIQRGDVLTRAVPEHLALAHGQLRGEPVTLQTRRYSGPVWDDFLIAELTTPKETVVLNLTGYPARGSPVPILGVDLVAMAGSLSLVAVDLSPTHEEIWTSLARPLLLQLREETTNSRKARPIPAATQHVFSELAVIASAERGAETEVLKALIRFFERISAWKPQPRLPEIEAQTAWARGIDWRRAELQNRREFDAIGRMFGTEFATSYLQGLLFALPEEG